MNRLQAHALLPLALLAASCIFGEQEVSDATPDQGVITTPDMTTSSPDQGEPDADIPDADVPDADLPDDSLPDSGAPDLDMPADIPVVCEAGGSPIKGFCFYPESCEDLAQTFDINYIGRPQDGDYTLFFRGNARNSWQGHCVDMSTQRPKTYLPLPSKSLQANTAVIWPLPTDGELAGITVKYTKIRVVPTMGGVLVDLYDDAFSGPPLLPNLRKIYAHTTSCSPDAPGSFNIDLSDTPFKIKTSLGVEGTGEVSVDGVVTDVQNAGVLQLRRVDVGLTSSDNDGGCATAAPAAFIAGYMGGEPPTMGLHLPLIYEPRGN